MDITEERINNLVDTITSDYENGRAIDCIKPFKHPDEDILINIISQLRSIIFPHISGQKPSKAVP